MDRGPTRDQATPALGRQPDRSARLTAADDLQLAYRNWLPASEAPRAAVALLHGYAEHGLRYSRVATALADRHALAVHLIDFRGHGFSDGPRGHVDSFTDYHHDVDALLGAIRAAHPELPTTMLAHSMGGLVATDYLQTRGPARAGIRACALSSPYFGLRHAPRRITRLVASAVSRVAPRFSLGVDLAGSSLCSDPAIAAEHDLDPLVFSKATARWAHESLRAHRRVLARATTLDLPVLVLYGTDDCIASPTATAALVARLPRCEAEALDEKHEILNAAEPVRSALIDRIGRWLTTHA